MSPLFRLTCATEENSLSVHGTIKSFIGREVVAPPEARDRSGQIAEIVEFKPLSLGVLLRIQADEEAATHLRDILQQHIAEIHQPWTLGSDHGKAMVGNSLFNALADIEGRRKMTKRRWLLSDPLLPFSCGECPAIWHEDTHDDCPECGREIFNAR